MGVLKKIVKYVIPKKPCGGCTDSPEFKKHIAKLERVRKLRNGNKAQNTWMEKRS